MRLRWERVDDATWEGYDDNDFQAAEIRREGRQYRWVVLDGFTDSTGTARTLKEAKAAAARRARPML